MCLCLLLAIICVIYVLKGHILAVMCIYVDITNLWISLCHCSCPILSQHPLSYDTEISGFCVVMCCLCNDFLIFTVMTVITLLPCVSIKLQCCHSQSHLYVVKVQMMC